MKKVIMGTVIALAATQPALAADSDYSGHWMVRARALEVMPQVSSTMNIADKVKIDNSLVPEIDGTYFFTPHIAAELIAAVTPHDVTTKGGVDAGRVWLLPPTLTLQYHYTDLAWAKPYVGAGVNYTHFYDAKGADLHSVSYDDSVGGALQVGVDIPIKNNWYFNFDVKKIWISTTAKFSPSGVRADVNINPWLVGVGFGYRF